MPSSFELVAGLSSVVVRLGSYIFLRWIPGHHFPPIIIASVVIYLICIFRKPEAFRPPNPTLPNAFPAASEAKEPTEVNDQEASTIDQRDKPLEPIFDRDERSIIQVLMLGVPDWGEKSYTYLTIGINLLLALLTLDMVFRGPLLHPSSDLRFSRVGYVDSTSAKILFREPDPSQLPVYAYYRRNDAFSWTTADRIYYLGEDTDFTYPLELENLKPASTYTYSLSNNLSGTFMTPARSSNRLTFLTSSCIKANFPYNPFSNALSIPGFRHLSRIVRSLPKPGSSFMLFIGDFIYVDVPLRLSSTLSHYRSEYRRVYASPSWQLPGLSTLPWIHTLDDHEIANDWSAGNTTEPFPAASDPFIHYHVSVNPPTPPAAPAGPESNTTYFQFTRGPASFFMLDTRRYRTDPEPQSSSIITATRGHISLSKGPSTPPNNTHHTMLGEPQLNCLLKFLGKPEPANVHWKIIASSVPFTKNWRFGTSDSWGGFLRERSLVLSAMHAAERNLGVRVVILSGDRHEFGAIRFPPPSPLRQPEHGHHHHGPEQQEVPLTVYAQQPQAGPHEFSVSPLSMFYLPFRTFRQVDDEDLAIKYLPDGNSKVGVVDITNLKGVGEQKSLLRYSLWIDGSVAWEYTLTSPGPTYVGDGYFRGGIFDGLWG